MPSAPPPTQTEEPPVTAEPGVTLSPEQTHVLSKVKSGGNVFFTGSAGRFHDNTEGFLISHVAGTGKSVLLRQIIGWARWRRKGDTDVAVTASTGMAAVNIGGVTLHSWAGIGLGQGDLKRYVEAVKFGPGHWKKVRERWMGVKTLIIDESNVSFRGSGPPADKMDSIYDRRCPIRQTRAHIPRRQFVLYAQRLHSGMHSPYGQTQGSAVRRDPSQSPPSSLS